MKAIVCMPSTALCGIVWQRLRAAFVLSGSSRPLACRWVRARCMAICPALALLAVVPLSAAQAQVPDENAGSDLSAYVSPNLDPAEQELMRTYMNEFSLDAKLRIRDTSPENVHVAIVDGATGIIHYNHTEDVGSLEVQEGLSLPGDEHPSVQSDEPPSDPTQSGNPGVFGGSGPYRRVYTVPVKPIPRDTVGGFKGYANGKYVTSGWVTTACKSGAFAAGDTGYAYLGGWSGGWNTVKGALALASVVDAGLQYSPALDDYAMFMNLGKPTGIIHKGNSPDAVQPFRIACAPLGKTHLIFTVAPEIPPINPPSECLWEGKKPTFFGPSQACVAYGLILEADSDHVEGRIGKVTTQFILWVAPSVDTGGWADAFTFVGTWSNGKKEKLYRGEAPCDSCIFKWMTSIAQKKQNLKDGSTNTATWSQRQISVYAIGKNTGALTSLTPDLTDCTEYPLWNPPYSNDYKADCKNTPSGLEGVANTIGVTGYSSVGETDTITAKY